MAHGVYASADASTDAPYLIHLRCEQAVFSPETGLFFHDLTVREPAPYSITVKAGYNPIEGGILVTAMIGLNARSTMDLDATVKGIHVNAEDLEQMN